MTRDGVPGASAASPAAVASPGASARQVADASEVAFVPAHARSFALRPPDPDRARRLERWVAARRVLCIRLDSMGDVLMTGPAMAALRGAVPGRTITLLTSPEGAAAGRLMPGVDEIIEYAAPWTGPDPSESGAPLPEVSASEGSLVETLRGRFDAAVIHTVYSQSPLPAALICRMAGIPLRLASCRENPYGLLTDWVPEIEPELTVRHEVRRQLDLVASLGIEAADAPLRIAIPDSARGRTGNLVRKRLAAAGIEGGRWLVVHPGARAESRRYPHFAAVSRGLAAEGFGLVFTGDGADLGLVDGIRSSFGVPTVSFAGELDLREAAALLADAPLLLSNNTGVVHLAAAVGTPVVDLYALTNPQHTPWAVPSRVLFHDVPCRGCYRSVCPEGHHDCLRLVAPQDVVRAVLDLWHEVSPTGLIRSRASERVAAAAAVPARSPEPGAGAGVRTGSNPA